MLGQNTHASFGQALKRIREGRGLTLRRIAEISRHVTIDTAGRISDGYLSALEQGKPKAVSLPKLLTLASIYRVPIEDLLALAPPRDAARLHTELKAWRDEGRPMPIVLSHPLEVIEAVERQIDSIASRTARLVSIPLRKEAEAKRDIRRLLIDSTIPPYMEAAGAGLSREFWAVKSTQIAKDFAGVTQSQVWYLIVECFAGWLLYERGVIADLLSRISTWTIDFHSERSTCHFVDRAEDRRFGYDAVPRRVVEAVRWRQAACLLAQTLPAGTLTLPSVPDPLDGVGEYIRYFLDLAEPLFGEPCGFGAAIAAIRDLADQVPELAHRGRPFTPDAHAAIVSLLKAAADGPRPPRRKPKR